MTVPTALRRLQEVIDEEKENMPNGVYMSLMASVQAMYDDDDDEKRYVSITYVHVTPRHSQRADARVYISIAQVVERGPLDMLEVIRRSAITESMFDDAVFPIVIRDNGEIFVVCNATEI